MTSRAYSSGRPVRAWLQSHARKLPASDTTCRATIMQTVRVAKEPSDCAALGAAADECSARIRTPELPPPCCTCHTVTGSRSFDHDYPVSLQQPDPTACAAVTITITITA